MPPIMGMPAGVWVAGLDEEGDASGGDWTVQHIFENVSNNLGDSNYYNLEQVMIHSNNSVNAAASVEVSGMDPGTQNAPNLQPIDQKWRVGLTTTDTPGVFGNALELRAQVPVWIGTFKGVDTEFGDILVRLENPTGSFTIGVKLQGFWWVPDAINAPGGMRRPPGAIFG